MQNEQGCIVAAFADPLATGLVRRTMSAIWGCRVEVHGDWASVSRRLAAGGVDVLVSEAACVDRASLIDCIEDGFYKGDVSVVMVSSDSDWPEGVVVLDPSFSSRDLEAAAESVFNARRRAGEQQYIAQMSGAVVSTATLADAERHTDGSWTRQLPDGQVEVGVDVARWINQGKLLCVEHMDVSEIQKGEPYARLLAGDGSAEALLAPMDGRVVEKNIEANGAVCVLASRCISEGWALWLLRVKPA